MASACTTVPAGGMGLAKRPKPIAPVRVSEERVARVIVGLRPFRPSGFRVEREMFGDKTVVHNYGHGGGGITLSWGTSKLALDEGFDPDVTEYAVLGAGAVGLATAMLLLERGAKVTIYAKALSPDTTSNIAGGQWWPASVYREEVVDAAFIAQHTAAAKFAFERYQLLTGPEYGVSWEVNYQLSASPITDKPSQPGHPMYPFRINSRSYEPGELPFNAAYARSFDTMMVDTPYYLRVLERDIRLRGGEIVVKDFRDISEVLALPETVVFNCTGLGAGALFGDNEIRPARGQLVVLEPQPEIDYNVLSDSHAYMFARRDGVILGGTFQEGNWSLDPSAEDTAHILAANAVSYEGMPWT